MKLVELLQKSIALGASDLHLLNGAKATVRVDGALMALDSEVLEPKIIDSFCREALGIDNHETFELGKEHDFAFDIDSVGRFRANIYLERGSLAVSIRLLPTRIPSFGELALPSIFTEFCQAKSGLILVTGSTGSGKSTTLASMIDHINQNHKKHIITIEDPVEFIHTNKNSLFSQRSICDDSDSFEKALKYALRQDPDVIMVGEMRDATTISAVITAAQTGHLVMSTLHTNSAVDTINRIVSSFDADKRPNIRASLADCLLAVVSQELLVKKGGGRVLACEVMINNKAIANLIREDKVHQIYSQIELGKSIGMVTMSESIKKLVDSGVIDKR